MKNISISEYGNQSDFFDCFSKKNPDFKIKSVPTFVINTMLDKAISKEKAKEIEAEFGCLVDPKEMELELICTFREYEGKKYLAVRYATEEFKGHHFAAKAVEVKNFSEAKNVMVESLPEIIDEYVDFHLLYDDTIASVLAALEDDDEFCEDEECEEDE